MAIDWSFLDAIPGAIKKPRVKALAKADKVKAIEKKDGEENAKVKARSGGRCEVVVVPGTGRIKSVATIRCHRPGMDPHHLIGGIGRRNRGKSILATYKLWVCRECHDAITGKILRPTTAEHDAHTVRYWRAK